MNEQQVPTKVPRMLRDVAGHIDDRQAKLLGSAADRVTAEYGRKRTRYKIASELICRKPDWDILLDLYVRTAHGTLVQAIATSKLLRRCGSSDWRSKLNCLTTSSSQVVRGRACGRRGCYE
jgi:hypothetical protein